jgi:hypothetical protein
MDGTQQEDQGMYQYLSSQQLLMLADLKKEHECYTINSIIFQVQSILELSRSNLKPDKYKSGFIKLF